MLEKGFNSHPWDSWTWLPCNTPYMMVFTLWSSAGSHKHSWVTECCSTTAAKIKCAITPPPCLSSRQKKSNTQFSPQGQSRLEGEHRALQTPAIISGAAGKAGHCNQMALLLPTLLVPQRLQLTVLLDKIPALKSVVFPILLSAKASAGWLLYCPKVHNN